MLVREEWPVMRSCEAHKVAVYTVCESLTHLVREDSQRLTQCDLVATARIRMRRRMQVVYVLPAGSTARDRDPLARLGKGGVLAAENGARKNILLLGRIIARKYVWLFLQYTTL